MKNHCGQYPHAYAKSNELYVYYGDDGTKYQLKAGESGVTQEWITCLKRLHREELNADRRFRRPRRRDEQYFDTVISLDAYEPEEAERIFYLTSSAPCGEDILVGQEERARLRRGLVLAWNALDPRQRELLVKAYIQQIPQIEIARAEGVDATAIRHRLKRILEKMKNFSKRGPFWAFPRQ